MPKRVTKCTTKFSLYSLDPSSDSNSMTHRSEKDPAKAAKRLKNNEAARRYRERKRRQLELKQQCWEALQQDHSKLFKKAFRKKKIQKLIKLIGDPQKQREWTLRLLRR